MACGSACTSGFVVFPWADLCCLFRSMVRSLVCNIIYVANFHRSVSGEVPAGLDANLIALGSQGLESSGSLGLQSASIDEELVL